MKKIFSLITIICLSILICGCNNEKNLEMSLSDIMESVYKNVNEEKLPMMLVNNELTKDNLKGYTGLDDLEFEEGIASESMVGSIAHSVVLVKVDDKQDINKIKKDIKENINPRKWLCVGVDDEENVIVDNIGNVVILIMDNDIAQELHNNFKSLNK